ncbi:DUF3800 domain-containing protein [Flavobacterium suncheonense]|nr:DUF3800 domain-containing protein [Flavobacterium suncheonense]
MYKFYCDDTAITQTKENHFPVNILGGILIKREDEIRLSNSIKKIKSKYILETLPIKYNLKDVQQKYKEFKKLDEFEKLKSNYNDFRKEIINEMNNYDVKIIISCVENFQQKPKNQGELKRDLSSYLFANTLMRLGLIIKENNSDYTQVILDWPEGNDPKPFDKEYFYAYNKGTSSSGQPFFSGALKNLNFDQTLYYARCHHSNLLQLSDIIIGSTRDWASCLIQNRDYSIGKELTELFMHKFHGYPNNILGQGINVSSNSPKFKQKLSEILKKYGV